MARTRKRQFAVATLVGATALIVAILLMIFASPPKVAEVSVRLSAATPDTCSVRIRKGETEKVGCEGIVRHFRERDVPSGTGVIISAGKGVPYGPVGQIMVTLQDAGYLVNFMPDSGD